MSDPFTVPQRNCVILLDAKSEASSMQSSLRGSYSGGTPHDHAPQNSLGHLWIVRSHHLEGCPMISAQEVRWRADHQFPGASSQRDVEVLSVLCCITVEVTRIKDHCDIAFEPLE